MIAAAVENLTEHELGQSWKNWWPGDCKMLKFMNWGCILCGERTVLSVLLLRVLDLLMDLSQPFGPDGSWGGRKEDGFRIKPRCDSHTRHSTTLRGQPGRNS